MDQPELVSRETFLFASKGDFRCRICGGFIFLLLTSEEKSHLQLDNLDWPGKIGTDPGPDSLAFAGPEAWCQLLIVKCLAIQEDDGATLESHLFTTGGGFFAG